MNNVRGSRNHSGMLPVRRLRSRAESRWRRESIFRLRGMVVSGVGNAGGTDFKWGTNVRQDETSLHGNCAERGANFAQETHENLAHRPPCAAARRSNSRDGPGLRAGNGRAMENSRCAKFGCAPAVVGNELSVIARSGRRYPRILANFATDPPVVHASDQGKDFDNVSNLAEDRMDRRLAERSYAFSRGTP